MDFVTELKYYEYELVEVTEYQGNLVYVISFIPDRRKAKFEGKLYVSNDDYAVLKADYAYADGKVGDKVNLKFLLGIKVMEDIKTGTVIYEKNEATHTYFPKYSYEETGQYIYVHRPLKFKENNEETKNKVAFDFLVEGHVIEKTELLKLNTSPLDSATFNALEEKKEESYQLLAQYDKNIWENTVTLEPLAEMKRFKAEE